MYSNWNNAEKLVKKLDIKMTNNLDFKKEISDMVNILLSEMNSKEIQKERKRKRGRQKELFLQYPEYFSEITEEDKIPEIARRMGKIACSIKKKHIMTSRNKEYDILEYLEEKFLDEAEAHGMLGVIFGDDSITIHCSSLDDLLDLFIEKSYQLYNADREENEEEKGRCFNYVKVLSGELLSELLHGDSYLIHHCSDGFLI